MSYLLVTRPSAHGEGCGGCRQGLDEARAMFRLFHCFPGTKVVRQPCRRLIPKVLVHLGYLRGLIYSSDRGSPGRYKTYVHFMETPPRLTCDPRGSGLYIVGGRYRVTPWGIEG